MQLKYSTLVLSVLIFSFVAIGMSQFAGEILGPNGYNTAYAADSSIFDLSQNASSEFNTHVQTITNSWNANGVSTFLVLVPEVLSLGKQLLLLPINWWSYLISNISTVMYVPPFVTNFILIFVVVVVVFVIISMVLRWAS